MSQNEDSDVIYDVLQFKRRFCALLFFFYAMVGVDFHTNEGVIFVVLVLLGHPKTLT